MRSLTNGLQRRDEDDSGSFLPSFPPSLPPFLQLVARPNGSSRCTRILLADESDGHRGSRRRRRGRKGGRKSAATAAGKHRGSEMTVICGEPTLRRGVDRMRGGS